MRTTIVLLLALVCLASAQEITTGGNVTQLNMAGENPTSRWDGVFGEVVLGLAANYTYTVTGNNITLLNVTAPQPGCIYSNLSMHIVAVNASWPTFPLSSGNLAILDSFINLPAESGTATFNETAPLSFQYGTFASVPSLRTYAGGSPSPYFREYYLNDAVGNLVFVADISSDLPNWNGTTSDYQIMLPNNGSPIGYTIWIITNYTCAPEDDDDDDKDHDLHIHPPGSFDVPAGSTFSPGFVVENTGDYTENGITVSLTCPVSFSCGSGTIASLGIGDSAISTIPITVDGPGDYVLTVCANNAHASSCQDFLVHVTAECVSDVDCDPGEYCADYECEPKKPPPEPCGADNECTTGLCVEGICSFCSEDSDCYWNQTCELGVCMDIPCPCGSISNHACVPYACCADSDCGVCGICMGTSCEKQELEILVSQGNMIEGEEARVQVLDNLGRPVAGAEVFTSGMRTTTDAHGYAAVILPYDGIVYARTSCNQSGVMLTITRLGYFVLPGEIFVGDGVTIYVVDSTGAPIPGATVYVDRLTLMTDGDGAFTVVFDSSGQNKLRGAKSGYLIEDTSAYVMSREAGCSFPVLLGWLMFYPASTWQLWLFSILLALVNLWLVHKRSRQKTMFKLAYAAAPLILALPDWWLFSICFMSNIVLLQFFAELLLILWKIISPFPSDEKGGVEKRLHGSKKSHGRLPPSPPEKKK
jgi:hypothetical protein